MMGCSNGVDMCLHIGKAMVLETGVVELTLLRLRVRMLVLMMLEMIFYLLMLWCRLWVWRLLIVI